MSRYDTSLRIIQQALREVPKGTPRKEVERILFDLYPYGRRSHHPYKMWRKAVRDCLHERAKFDAFARPSTEPAPLFTEVHP